MRFLLALGGACVVNAQANRPVQKAINLLRDIGKQLDEEQKKSAKVYDKLKCWCESGAQEKAASVKKAAADVDSLAGTIEENSALVAQLQAEIDRLKRDVTAAEEALKSAGTMHDKTMASGHDEEMQLTETIGSLKGAITILPSGKKHQGGNFLQTVESTLKLPFVRKSSEAQELNSLLQGANYQSNSGEIFGLLNQMLENFKQDLADTVEKMEKEDESYNSLVTAKKRERDMASEQLEAKMKASAEASKTAADSKVERRDTKRTLKADQKFLSDLAKECATADQDFEKQTQSRNAEQRVVADAISILDNASAAFSKTVEAPMVNFLQNGMVSNSKFDSRRQQAMRLLRASKAPMLLALAEAVSSDSFKQVIDAIDSMVRELKRFQRSEKSHHKHCKERLEEVEHDLSKRESKKKELTTSAKLSASQLDALVDKIQGWNDEIEHEQASIKEAGIQREQANAIWQQLNVDCLATENALTAAIAKLKAVYSQGSTALIVKKQARKTASAAPRKASSYEEILDMSLLDADASSGALPGSIEKHENNSGGETVIGLLEDIKADNKAKWDEARRDEKDAQRAYEEFVKDSNEAIADYKKSISEAKAQRAGTEQKAIHQKRGLESVSEALVQLDDEQKATHEDCDFILANFDNRQAARVQEIEALKEAKNILSGFQGSLLEKGKRHD